MIANIAPQTASSHLAKLISGNLLAVEKQGRHRYYRLAGAEVAHAIEALAAIAPEETRRPSSRDHAPGALSYARSCYSHLAGKLAVQLAETMMDQGILRAGEKHCLLVTRTGRTWLEEFGIPISDHDLRDERYARRCLDWTERRHHIAGRLGSAMFARLLERRWMAKIRDSRAIRVTLEGERGLNRLLRSGR